MQQKQLVHAEKRHMFLLIGLADEVSHIFRQKTLEEEVRQQSGIFLHPQHLNPQTPLWAALKPTKSCKSFVFEVSDKLPTLKTELNVL